MKKISAFFQIIVLSLIISACSNNPASSKYVPPAPKPDNYVDTIAVAAKKADFYARLAFDLADGYLSDQSVVRKRYGKDSKYVESLNFPLQEDTTGEISSSAISAPIFKYFTAVTTITYSELYKLPTRALQRDKIIGTATGATYPSVKFDITFSNTDTTAEKINLPVVFTHPGRLTELGAKMDITEPFTIYVQNSFGDANSFRVTVNNVEGEIKVTGSGYKPKPADEFSMNSGSITIEGTDTSVIPNVTYNIILEYSNDKVENKTGNFTGKLIDDTVVFSANYTIDKDTAFYTKGSDLTRKYYVYWDHPL